MILYNQAIDFKNFTLEFVSLNLLHDLSYIMLFKMQNGNLVYLIFCQWWHKRLAEVSLSSQGLNKTFMSTLNS